MTQQKQNHHERIIGALAVGALAFLIGYNLGGYKQQRKLDKEIVGNSIVIEDKALHKRAELTDIDRDGKYDCLQISSTLMPGRYGGSNRPLELYMKPGFLARSPPYEVNLHIIEADKFDRFVDMQIIPLPKDSLLNKKKVKDNLTLYGSYSGLFNPLFEDKLEQD